jgi:hypothetical protein
VRALEPRSSSLQIDAACVTIDEYTALMRAEIRALRAQLHARQDRLATGARVARAELGPIDPIDPLALLDGR